MALVSSGIIAMSAQALLLFSLICCTLSAKIPQVASEPQAQQQSAKITSTGVSSGTVPASLGSQRLPIVTSSDDLEVVAHTGGDSLRQKRYIGWGRRPSLRYNKAVSVFDHDSLFNRLHNNFDKRAGPEAPISSFRELRMKQKVPNIQLLLPHLQLRNTRTPQDDPQVSDDYFSDLTNPITQEQLEALMYFSPDWNRRIPPNQERNGENE